MLKCTKCFETKSDSEFYRRQDRPKGHYSRCKSCIRIATKAYSKALPLSARRKINKRRQQKFKGLDNDRLAMTMALRRRSKTSKAYTLMGVKNHTEAWNHLLQTWEDNYVFPWDGEPWHLDHIVPISKGGAHHISNLQLLTPFDNRRKGDSLDWS